MITKYENVRKRAKKSNSRSSDNRRCIVMKWELLNDAPFLDSILRECMLGCPDFREGRQYGFMIVFGIWGESNKILLKIYKHTWQYLSELTGGKGVTFATGTPISNSMTELYTNMRYLQYGTLQKLGLGHFDSWASSFGETQTAIDIACQL